jgi:hypothetical protein
MWGSKRMCGGGRRRDPEKTLNMCWLGRLKVANQVIERRPWFSAWTNSFERSPVVPVGSE